MRLSVPLRWCVCGGVCVCVVCGCGSVLCVVVCECLVWERPLCLRLGWRWAINWWRLMPGLLTVPTKSTIFTCNNTAGSNRTGGLPCISRKEYSFLKTVISIGYKKGQNAFNNYLQEKKKREKCDRVHMRGHWAKLRGALTRGQGAAAAARSSEHQEAEQCPQQSHARTDSCSGKSNT